MIRAFIDYNVKICKFFESFFNFKKNDKLLAHKFFDRFDSESMIADVGGGKKPAKLLMQRNVKSKSYDGYDIDLKELLLAEYLYTSISFLDLNNGVPKNVVSKYDYVICLNTLEHVSDAEAAIKSIADMLAENGEAYLKAPCRHAVFAKLNLILPQKFKTKLLHYIYPHKSGDGFRVFYDKSTPKEYMEILKRNDLNVQDVRLIKYSTYFSFFFPLYFVWRLITLVQNLFIEDYCESFEIIVKKGSNENCR